MTYRYNPLIGASDKETIENASEALNSLTGLMAQDHSDLCRLMTPIVHALDVVAHPPTQG